MGKIVKSVLKIAAVAAISFFAPPLAAAVAPAIGVGGALGTTVLAAGIGAGAGELAGVGWKAGLLAGGLSGAGQSGLFGGKAASTAGGGTASTAGTATSTPSPFLNPQTPASLSGYPAAAGPAVSPFLNPQTPALLAAPGTAAAGTAGGLTLGGALSKAASNPLGALGSGVKNLTSAASGALGAAGLGAGGLNLGGAAPMLLAAGLVGNPGGAMAKAQEQELMRAQQVNAALTQQRLDEANKLIGDAAYYDPEYMARQAAEAAMIKGGIQTAEQTRGLTGERLAAERRRMRLGTARSAGTAYQQGYGTGVGARTQTRQAGISAIPTEYAMTNPSGAIAARNAAAQAKANETAGLSALFGQVLGQGQTASLGM